MRLLLLLHQFKSVKKLIPFRLAVTIVVTLNIAIIVFHLLVLGRVIPFNIVWGGRLKTIDEMLVFEAISIILNGLLVFVVTVRAKWLTVKLPIKLINGMLWIFVILFIINTVGNLNAITSLEMLIATPITALLAILCWRIAIE